MGIEIKNCSIEKCGTGIRMPKDADVIVYNTDLNIHQNSGRPIITRSTQTKI